MTVVLKDDNRLSNFNALYVIIFIQTSREAKKYVCHLLL